MRFIPREPFRCFNRLVEGRRLGKIEVNVLGNRFANQGFAVAQHGVAFVQRFQDELTLEWWWLSQRDDRRSFDGTTDDPTNVATVSGIRGAIEPALDDDWRHDLSRPGLGFVPMLFMSATPQPSVG